MSFFQNTCKPKGWGGKFMVKSMNKGHAAMAEWGFQHLQVQPTDCCLDVGCGGGANVKRLLSMTPGGVVKAVDYSEVSVQATTELNQRAIQEGRCVVLQGNVMDLLFARDCFDVVTAFETIYFWPDLTKAFQEVCRVLKDDGVFMICNEADGKNPKDEKWVKKIDGMRIYDEEQLRSILMQAGFTRVEIDTNDKHWLCAIARK